jgi:hypothetical protein
MTPCTTCNGTGQSGVGKEWHLCVDCCGHGHLLWLPQADGTRRERIALALVCANPDRDINVDRLMKKVRAVESVLDHMGVEK